MNSKHQFGGQPIDFHEMARTAVRQVRDIITSEPLSPRGLFWSVMWEAAQLGHQRMAMTLLEVTTNTYRPSPEDLALTPRLAMAIYFERALLDEPLPRHRATVVKLWRKDEPPDCGEDSVPGELSQ